MPEFIKQILHTQLFSVLNILVGIISIVLMIKYFHVSEYGTYVLIQGFMSLACLVFSQNIFAYSRLKISGAQENIQYGYLKTVLILVLLGYFAIILVLHALKIENEIWFFFEIEVKFSSFVLAMLALEIVNSEIMRFFIATKKIVLKNYAQFAQKIVVLSGILILVLYSAFNILNFLYVFILGQVVVFGILSANLSIARLFRSPFMKDVVKKGYTVALPLVPVGLMAIALNYTDTLMIAKFIDKNSVAQYGLASQVITMTMMVIGTSIVLTLFPYAVEAHNRQDMSLRTYFFSKMFDFSFFLSILFYLLVSINSKMLINLAELNQYSDVPCYLLILGAFPIFQGIYNVTSHHLQLLNFFKAQALIAVFIIITNAILNYFFIHLYGVIGAAYASLISFILLSGICVIILCYCSLEIRALLQKKWPKFLFILFFSLLFVYSLYYFEPAVFVKLIFNILIAGSVFLLLITLKKGIAL